MPGGLAKAASRVHGEALHFQTIVIAAHIIEGKALLFEGKAGAPPTVIFDLNEKSWRDVATDKSMTLKQAEEWAQTTRAQMLKSLDSSGADDVQSKLIRLMLEPNLKTTEPEGKLAMKNDLFSFVITPAEKIPNAWLESLFAYDRLNAYRRAMAARELPPFTQLEVLDELAKRHIWPSTMDMTVTTPRGNMDVKSTLKVAELSKDERAADLQHLSKDKAE